jgi:TrmH family RNA methyltransferase
MVGFGLSELALVKPAADIFDPRVIRASMGALFRLNFDYFDSFDAYRSTFPHHLYPFLTDGATPLHEATFDSPYALIFGSESSGLPDAYRRLGASVTIPHSYAIDSLNLSVAVGIALYAATKGAF